jgi:hypothetical protein
MRFQELLKVREASSRQRHVFRKILRAADYPGSEGRGKAHGLFLKELGILKGSQALDPVEEGRR